MMYIFLIIDLLLTKVQLFTSQDVNRSDWSHVWITCGLLLCFFFSCLVQFKNVLRNEMFNFSQDFTVFHSFPEGHLDRRGESGQEQSWDLLTLLSSRLWWGRWGRWWLVTAQRASCSAPGLSCRDLSLVLFACSLSRAADRKGFGSVRTLLSPSLLLY